MPLDTALFQLSALGLLGLILVVALIALVRIGKLKRALAERPSTTAADVVPFAKPEARPSTADAHDEPPPYAVAEPEDHAERAAEPAAAEEEKREPVAAEPEEVAEPERDREPELVPEGEVKRDPGAYEVAAEPEPVFAEPEPEREPVAQAAEPGPAQETEAQQEFEPGLEPEREPVGSGAEVVPEHTGATTAPEPAAQEAGARAEVLTAPSTVTAQQEQVVAGADADERLSSERTWDEIAEQTEAPASDEPHRREPETATASWAYDWARDMPEEQPVERDGRWWFKRGGELLLYDETTAQWVPAPVSESPEESEGGATADTVQFGGAAADVRAETQSSFWKCPSCGAINGSTASTCRMCFAARP